jgi:hypothetical protein
MMCQESDYAALCYFRRMNCRVLSTRVRVRIVMLSDTRCSRYLSCTRAPDLCLGSSALGIVGLARVSWRRSGGQRKACELLRNELIYRRNIWIAAARDRERGKKLAGRCPRMAFLDIEMMLDHSALPMSQPWPFVNRLALSIRILLPVRLSVRCSLNRLWWFCVVYLPFAK